MALSRASANSAAVILAFRWLVAGCMAATIHTTWPLWKVHESPPMLPAIDLPAYNVGPALLLSLVVVLMFPLPGLMLHTGILLYAVLIDQTRLQPEVVSLLILMWGRFPRPVPELLSAPTFARCGYSPA